MGFRLYFCKGDEKCCIVFMKISYRTCVILLYCIAKVHKQHWNESQVIENKHIDDMIVSGLVAVSISSFYFVATRVLGMVWYCQVRVTQKFVFALEDYNKIFFLIPKFNTKLNEIQSIKINHCTLGFPIWIFLFLVDALRKFIHKHHGLGQIHIFPLYDNIVSDSHMNEENHHNVMTCRRRSLRQTQTYVCISTRVCVKR